MGIPTRVKPPELSPEELLGGADWSGGFYAPKFDLGWMVARDDVAALPQVIRHVDRRQLCVQAGGYIGIFPDALSFQFGNVVTLEPQKESFECLERNVKRGNVVAKRAALWSVSATASMKGPLNNRGAWHLITGDDVPCIRVDDMELHALDLLYLDVEGAEGQALLGAQQTIQRLKPVIVIDGRDLEAQIGGVTGESRRFLTEVGYYPVASVGDDVVFKWRAH